MASKLAWEIYRELEAKGAGIGSASVPIIDKVISSSDMLEVCKLVIASYMPDKQAFDVLAMRTALDKARAIMADLG